MTGPRPGLRSAEPSSAHAFDPTNLPRFPRPSHFDGSRALALPRRFRYVRRVPRLGSTVFAVLALPLAVGFAAAGCRHKSKTPEEAFQRFAREGRPAAEVAEELGTSVNAVLQAKSRVLNRLREEAAGLLD